MPSPLYTLETGKVTWTSLDASQGTYYKDITFSGSYSKPPIITLLPVPDSESGNLVSTNVNVFVSDLTQYTMRVNVSGLFIGNVHYKAIQYN